MKTLEEAKDYKAKEYKLYAKGYTEGYSDGYNDGYRQAMEYALQAIRVLEKYKNRLKKAILENKNIVMNIDFKEFKGDSTNE